MCKNFKSKRATSQRKSIRGNLFRNLGALANAQSTKSLLEEYYKQDFQPSAHRYDR